MKQLRAVIWIADDEEWARYTARCLDYCTRLGYEVAAVVEQRAGGRWEDVYTMVVTDGRAEVVVVASRDQLPRDRVPRIEAVADERRHLVPTRRDRDRPTFLRRS